MGVALIQIKPVYLSGAAHSSSLIQIKRPSLCRLGWFLDPVFSAKKRGYPAKKSRWAGI
jgi:hypothetical protein